MESFYFIFKRYGVREVKLLVDIGNTHFHIYDGKSVKHLTHDDAIEQYKEMELYYISVKHQLSFKIKEMKNWIDISSSIKIEGEYETMGVDRKALCLSHKNGVFIDAGSAITVDVVDNGIYMGGYIFPGLNAMLDSYKNISPALEITLNKNILLTELPTTTKDGISYGIIASIKALIDKQTYGKKLYFTGGDGEFLSSLFENSVYDELLVFNGMSRALKDNNIC